MTAIELNERVKRPTGAIFVPYAPDHFSYINTNNQDIVGISNLVSVQQMIDAQSELGPAVTVLLHGRPVGIFGAGAIWPGVAELWFIPDEELRRYPLFMCHGAKAFIDITAISMCLHRQQITVRCDHNRAVKWAATIGFKAEGTLQAYGPDRSDFYIMSIVRQV